jgi:hypothetical protein
MLWTVGRLDDISRRLDICCSTDESSDGCKGFDYTILKSAQNLLETYL